jgi:hypothetical protein
MFLTTKGMGCERSKTVSEEIKKQSDEETASGELSAEDLKELTSGDKSNHQAQTLQSSVQKKLDDTANAVISKI